MRVSGLTAGDRRGQGLTCFVGLVLLEALDEPAGLGLPWSYFRERQRTIGKTERISRAFCLFYDLGRDIPGHLKAVDDPRR